MIDNISSFRPLMLRYLAVLTFLSQNRRRKQHLLRREKRITLFLLIRERHVQAENRGVSECPLSLFIV